MLQELINDPEIIVTSLVALAVKDMHAKALMSVDSSFETSGWQKGTRNRPFRLACNTPKQRVSALRMHAAFLGVRAYNTKKCENL